MIRPGEIYLARTNAGMRPVIVLSRTLIEALAHVIASDCEPADTAFIPKNAPCCIFYRSSGRRGDSGFREHSSVPKETTERNPQRVTVAELVSTSVQSPALSLGS
jgi:hypothetical protein